MGEATYYLKARFESPKILNEMKPKIESFFKETGEACDFWQKHRSEDRKVFWKEFKKKFPMTTKYLGNLAGKDNNNGLAGQISFGGSESNMSIDGLGVVLLYNEYTWHLASWDRLCDFLVSEFKATKAEWVSDEYINPYDVISV